MNEATAAPAAAVDGPSAGTLLRRAREAAGLHVAAVAVSLKVPVRKLEALEEDRHDLLTDSVFVRALASSVCRTLRIDPQPILARLPQTATPRLVRDIDGINAPFRSPRDGAAPSWFDQLTRPVFLGVFALLLGALVLILLPSRQDDAAPVAKTETDDPPAPAAAPVLPVVEAVVTTSTAAPAAEREPASFVAPVSALGAAVPVAAAPASAVAAGPAAPASGVVIFRAKGPSWIEVTDAKGVVATRKLLNAGETTGASGALPLQVTIGRVDFTEVQIRGKPFDLRPVSKDNVARFEVK